MSELYDDLFSTSDDELDEDEAFASDRLTDSDNEQPEPPDETPEVQPDPVHQEPHRRRVAALVGANTPLAPLVSAVLLYMDSLGLDLTIFLHALSWADDGCTRDATIRHARTTLMHSDELPAILQNWCRPPQDLKRTRHRRATAASKALETFAVARVGDIIDEELDRVQDVARAPADWLSDSSFRDYSFAKTIERLSDESTGAPILWSLVQRTLCSVKERTAGTPTRRSPELAGVMMVSQMLYSRNQRCSLWPKLITLYLKSSGLSANGLDYLHKLGVTMSHRWSLAVETQLSEQSMKEAVHAFHHLPSVFAHDNLNIAFKKYSQRLDNHDHFDSGTGATLFTQPFRPSSNPLPDLSNPAFQQSRRTGSTTPITEEEILELMRKAGPSIRMHKIHEILKVLLRAPAFSHETYSAKDDPCLRSPDPINELPCGPEYVTIEYVMATLHIEEGSYAGNLKLLEEWLVQLDIITRDDLEQFGLEKLWPFVGDQLTVERLRGLINSRSQDSTSYDRLDHLVPIGGWFHLELAHTTSIYDQHVGTNAGKGLRHAFTNLERKGLSSLKTGSPYFHHLREGIMHSAEAHLRACWLDIADVEDLAELRSHSAEELREMAEDILDLYASVDAYELAMSHPDKEKDHVYANGIMFRSDALDYIILTNAIKCGDVGMMENLLPTLLCRFAGGSNYKYAIEVLDLLQCLHHEWTPELSTFVREFCWLVNMKGHRDSFLPIDLAQEHNIKAIKVTYRSHGPNSGWELLRRRSPTIPKMRLLRKCLDDLVPSVRRGSSHTAPQKEKDVEKLTEIYVEADICNDQPGRGFTFTGEDKIKEVHTVGWRRIVDRVRTDWIDRRAWSRKVDGKDGSVDDEMDVD